MIRVPLCASRDALGDVQFVCTRGRRCFPISRDLLCYAALGLCVCAAVLPMGCYTPSDALWCTMVVYRVLRCAMCAVSCVWGTFYDHGMVCVDRLMDPRRRGFVSQDTTKIPVRGT